MIDKIGYLDEIYGKGYHEESDFSFRAIVYGYKNVLIDDLYVYHKRCCSFGQKERSAQLFRNGEVYNSRYSVLRKIVSENINEKIIYKIEEELFPMTRWFYFGMTKNLKRYMIIP